MTNNYTEEDKKAFARKDILSARQSAAKNTAVIFEGKEVSFDIFKTYADLMFEWIYDGQKPMTDVLQAVNKSVKKSKTEGIISIEPHLTLNQKAVKEAVEKSLNRLVSVDDLLAWSNNQGYSGVIPANLKSVDKIVKFLEE